MKMQESIVKMYKSFELTEDEFYSGTYADSICQLDCAAASIESFLENIRKDIGHY